jgi:hypothetical protein
MNVWPVASSVVLPELSKTYPTSLFVVGSTCGLQTTSAHAGAKVVVSSVSNLRLPYRS